MEQLLSHEIISFSSNPQLQMLSIQEDFLKAIKKIQDFLHQKKNKTGVEKALAALDDAQGKFSDMMDIYSIAPENFPGLLPILSRNSQVFETNLTKVQNCVAQYGQEPVNWSEFIYTHCNGITEQYIKVAIEGLYTGLVSQALPSLPSIQAKEALTFSIVNLSDFFGRIIKEEFWLAHVLEQLEITQATLLSLEERTLDPASTYIVLIAGLFSNLKNISLSFDSQGIAKAMCSQLSILQKESGLINETLALQKIESSTMANFPHDFLPAYLTFSGFFNMCSKKTTVKEKINDIKNVLSKMYELYGESPDDFSGLPETFLENARNLKKKCQKFLFNEASLKNELNTFYDEMARRCFQMQICQAYNNSVCLVSDSTQTTNDWQGALTSVISTITQMHQKTGKQDSGLAGKFLALNQLLLWEGELPPVIVAAQQCVITLDRLFKDSPKIIDLHPKLLEKIIETLGKLQTHLETLLENSLSGNEMNKPERMQIPFTEIRLKKASTSTAMVASKPSEDFNVQYASTVSTIAYLFGFFSSKGKVKSRADELRAIAERYALICKNVAGDGNCLFTAIALYLKWKYPKIYQTGLPELSEDLRKRMTDYLSKNKDKYKEFIDDSEYKNIDAYIEAMSKSKTWGDHLSLHILAVILNVTIVVIPSNGSAPVVLRNPKADKDNVICLGYEVPVHYQLLLSKEGHLPQAVQNLIDRTEFMNLNLEKSFTETMVISKK